MQNLMSNLLVLASSGSTSSSSSASSTDVFQPLINWGWYVFEALMSLVSIACVIFLFCIGIWYLIQLAKHKDPEERKQRIHQLLTLIIVSCILLVVCSLLGVLVPLFTSHMVVPNLSN